MSLESSEKIIETRFSDALSERYLSYALSIIMSRSLPDVRDGLKPVHRRLLYAMRQLKLNPSSGFKKSARVVGDVIGKFHPHGDQAVYDTLVRLAQEFSIRYPLIEGQGNFGNIDGDSAAAMRYTEARLTQEAESLLVGLDEDTIDFRETYDGEEKEPVVLPAGFPNLLANGAIGIAVGMATSIPPHNLGEICGALLHLLKYPKATISKLLDLMPGPDFPTGGILVEARESILAAYKLGRGGFRVRSKWEMEKLAHGQYQIVVTEIPYQVQKSKLIEKIADLINSKKLSLVNDIVDESTDVIRIVLEPKNRGVDPKHLMEQLFSLTDLESRFSLNMNVIDAENVPRVMDLREILQSFLDHRSVILLRGTRFRLKEIGKKLEVLDAYLIAYLNLDEVIQIIRESEDAKLKLIKKFKLNKTQAEAILNMRLRRLQRLQELEIKAEHKHLTEEGKKLKKLLRNKDLQKSYLKDEITSIRKKYSTNSSLCKRRTEIGVPPRVIEIPIEVSVEREPITILCSKMGWIRAMKGHLDNNSSIKYKDGDEEKFFIHAYTTDKLLLFSSNGRFYTINCSDLPKGRGFGEPVRLLTDLDQGSSLVEILLYKDGEKLVLGSSSGRGFVVSTELLLTPNRTGKQILNIKEGEKAIACSRISGEHLAVVGDNHKLIIFPISELPELVKGRGVILQRYGSGGLSDLTTLNLGEGLSWKSGSRTRTETELTAWIGKRSQAGRLAPRGFPKNNRFR